MGKKLGIGKKQRERGAALTEAALVMPLLLLLVFGIWTVARAYNVRNTMEHAVREAVRFGATELPWDGTSVGQVEAVVDTKFNTSAIPRPWSTLCASTWTPLPAGSGRPPRAMTRWPFVSNTPTIHSISCSSPPP